MKRRRQTEASPRVGSLLVASTGGHLAELVKLAPRLGLPDRPSWITFPGRQAETLLAGQATIFARHTGPRDYLNVTRNAYFARSIFERRKVDRVISTGAGIALSFLATARAYGIEAHYIESAARPCGPSLTGRLLARIPGIHLYTQSPAWADDVWSYSGSVYDGFELNPMRTEAPTPLRVALTVGTLRFPFPRLVDRLFDMLPADAEVVLWQVGATQSANGRVIPERRVDPTRLLQAYAETDVVVCHAGVGSALEALDTGHCPVIVPRRASFGEHVDDHQVPLAKDLADRGLAIYREADELTLDDLVTAARSSVHAVPRPPAFALRSGAGDPAVSEASAPMSAPVA